MKSSFRSANDTFYIKNPLLLSFPSFFRKSPFSSTDIFFMNPQFDKPTQCFISLNLQNVTHCQSGRVIYVCNEMFTYEHG